MKLIVGLGNPGDQYESTRHNLGFTAVEQFVKDCVPVEKSIWKHNDKLLSDMINLDWQTKKGESEKVIVAKPVVYMNDSGRCIKIIMDYLKVLPQDLWLVHDDMDLDTGFMRIKFAGSSAGHKGVQSVMDYLQTDKFWRFRLGIGQEKAGFMERALSFAKRRHKNIEHIVLGKFTSDQVGKIKDVVRHCSKAISYSLEEGLMPAMNKFNTR